MNGSDATYVLSALAMYVFGAITAALIGDVEFLTDLLAGGGLGALFGQLVVLRRFRRGIRGREAQIVAAWSVVVALTTAGVSLVVGLR